MIILCTSASTERRGVCVYYSRLAFSVWPHYGAKYMVVTSRIVIRIAAAGCGIPLTRCIIMTSAARGRPQTNRDDYTGRPAAVRVVCTGCSIYDLYAIFAWCSRRRFKKIKLNYFLFKLQSKCENGSA